MLQIETLSIILSKEQQCKSLNNLISILRAKRERYESFLKSVDILSTIDNYEILQVSDALSIKKFKKGEKIITQGEQGDVFYILEEGTAFASKVFNEQGRIYFFIKKTVQKELRNIKKVTILVSLR